MTRDMIPRIQLARGGVFPLNQFQGREARSAQLSIQGMQLRFDPPNDFRVVHQLNGAVVRMTFAYTRAPAGNAGDPIYMVLLYSSNGQIKPNLRFSVTCNGPHGYQITRCEENAMAVENYVLHYANTGAWFKRIRIVNYGGSGFPYDNALTELQISSAADQAWRVGLLIDTLIHGQEVWPGGPAPAYELRNREVWAGQLAPYPGNAGN